MSVEDFAAAGRRGSTPTGDWRDGLAKTEDGIVLKNLCNACVALRDHPDLAGKLAYDEFAGSTYVRAALPWDDRPNRPWSQFDDLAATEWLQGAEVRVRVGSGIAREAVERVAYENRFHPVLEYLEGLKWDGKERLSGWLTTCLGVPQSPLSDAIGRKFLVAAVARVNKPGCKADHMPILEGFQGTLKSTALNTLVGDDWFADQIADLGSKDACQDLRGKWIIELSELSAIRSGEVERVKAYVSRRVDHYRPSYGRRSGDVPRQNVFVGSTNDTEYLSDPTGGRRFWPVTCSKIDINALARDRDQLWAEAVTAYHAGETWWLDDAELRRAAHEEQERRRIADPWESTIGDWLTDPKKQPDRDGYRAPIDLDESRVTVAQILEHAIGQPTARQTKSDQMRVGKILRLIGWTKDHTRTGKVWLPPDGRDHLQTGNCTQETPDSEPKGSHRAKVVTQGGHAENRGGSGFRTTVTTVTTSRACIANPESPSR
jgi:putative DNA primase/helicase